MDRLADPSGWLQAEATTQINAFFVGEAAGRIAPYLNGFISADTVVPEPGNPQALNQYAYAYKNPLKYNFVKRVK
jgi:hypothetical protein